MSSADQSEIKDFDEWMVTKALAIHLNTLTPDKQLEWFGGLDAKSGDKTGPLGTLFPAQWPTGEISGSPERPFTLTDAGDKGAIAEEEFKIRFQSATPDFRYWTKHRDKQLILEAKGTSKPAGRDADQAKRYFDYLRKWPSTGIVTYLVFSNIGWHDWLQRIAAESTGGPESVPIAFAVVELNDKVLASISPQLIRVVGESLVKAASLLGRALKLAK